MSDIVPFTDAALATIGKAASAVMARCQPVMNLWGRSHSNFVWDAQVVGAEYSPMRRLRQVAAELQKKQAAMREAEFSIRKRFIEMKIKRRDAQAETDQLRRELLEIEAEDLESQLAASERPYRGACEDVVHLGKLHDALLRAINADGVPTQADFEREESHYWVRRSFAQSLRDMREFGRICKGEQELLEQIGLDPLVVQHMMAEFLNSYRGSVDVSGAKIDAFLDECSVKFAGAVTAKMQRTGFDLAASRD